MTTPQTPHGHRHTTPPRAPAGPPQPNHRHAAPEGAPYGPAGTPHPPYGRPAHGPEPYGRPSHGPGPHTPGPQGPGYPAWGPPQRVRDSRGPQQAPAYARDARAIPPQPDHVPAPVPPPYPATATGRAPKNGFGTTALVLGILGVLFALIPIVGVIAWPLVVLGLIFGILGIVRTRSGRADNRGVAISGTVLSAIGLVLCIAWVSALGSAMPAATPAGSPVPAASGGEAASTATFPGATPDDVTGQAGAMLTIGDMEVTATALEPGDATFGSTLCSTVTYRNTGSTAATFSGLGDWKLQDPSGAALMTGLTGSTTPLSTGELAAGGTTAGPVCFDRPAATAGQDVLLFQPMLSFSSDRGAWLNQVG